MYLPGISDIALKGASAYVGLSARWPIHFSSLPPWYLCSYPYRNVQSGHAKGLTITSRHVVVIGFGNREAIITWLRAWWREG